MLGPALVIALLLGVFVVLRATEQFRLSYRDPQAARGPRRAARRTIGTFLGITWLAWLMSRPDDFS